ncbi:hypothetical protein [Methanoculleus sp. 7T]|uniref:hypothetical protein n=1 Tax=Methanoculleus sp. 7T TaxID=2937282 RepID=UPI0020C0F2CA|nr:hypothetical protein [Methanoculleus sp. 7T]MCK8518666.1 hypothetical protein [Methanoculleus sp. 7T]
MKHPSILLFALLLLAFGAGCTDLGASDTSKNATSAQILHYERGNVSIPINTSEIPVKSFDVNVTEVIEIALADQRSGVLLENGWNITSIRTGFEEKDPDQKHIDVEFRNDELPLSFFIEVDEEEKRAGRGRCSAPFWGGRPWLDTGPLSEEVDYYQSVNPYMNLFEVIDHGERVMMVYNKTTIFYLYPSYGDAHVWGP